MDISVVTFNDGMEVGLSALLKDIGITPGPRPIIFSKVQDKTRIKSDRISDVVAKRERKSESRQRAAEQAVVAEGTPYCAGRYCFLKTFFGLPFKLFSSFFCH